MKLLDKIFNRQPKLTPEQMILVQLSDGLRILESHMIAIARLQFIKPENLIREAKNTEANSNYLDELLNIRDNGKN